MNTPPSKVFSLLGENSFHTTIVLTTVPLAGNMYSTPIHFVPGTVVSAVPAFSHLTQGAALLGRCNFTPISETRKLRLRELK